MLDHLSTISKGGGPTPKARNVLFIMCDQLRFDYLSCYGARHLSTPNIDALAARGTRFDRAFVSAPVCGPSRMSFYTGRTTLSHGATWNFVPLPVGERTLGDYLRPAGIRTAVVGKTHHEPDRDGMRWLGLSPDDPVGQLFGEGGFEPYGRDDGIHPEGKAARHQAYNAYLHAKGYTGRNPWHEYANAGLDEGGQIASGWLLRNAHRAARIPDALSESAWTVDRSIEFIRQQGDRPWCLHTSFIKLHWPYIVSAPYHSMFSRDNAPAPIRSQAERGDDRGRSVRWRKARRDQQCLGRSGGCRADDSRCARYPDRVAHHRGAIVAPAARRRDGMVA